MWNKLITRLKYSTERWRYGKPDPYYLLYRIYETRMYDYYYNLYLSGKNVPDYGHYLKQLSKLGYIKYGDLKKGVNFVGFHTQITDKGIDYAEKYSTLKLQKKQSRNMTILTALLVILTAINIFLTFK